MPPDIAILTALRLLRTGGSCQQFDDQAGFSKTTINSRFKKVVRSIVTILGPIFLPDEPDAAMESQILQTMADRGFIGCAGSLDCTHVKWRCPKSHQPLYKGKESETTIVIQCIASPSLYCTNCFVGSAGSNNDLTTLRLSNFVHRILNGTSGMFTFNISGETFTRKYYLADGIYPPWSIFATPTSNPISTGEKRYVRRQESCRKDVERLFGVVKQRFKIMRSGNRIEYRDKTFLCDIVRACFILHNIMVLYADGGIGNVLDKKNRFEGSTPQTVAPIPTADFNGGAPQYDDTSDPDEHNAAVPVDSENIRLKASIMSRMVESTMQVINPDDHFRLRQALITFHANIA
jgi:hypothetical protein